MQLATVIKCHSQLCGRFLYHTACSLTVTAAGFCSNTTRAADQLPCACPACSCAGTAFSSCWSSCVEALTSCWTRCSSFCRYYQAGRHGCWVTAGRHDKDCCYLLCHGSIATRLVPLRSGKLKEHCSYVYVTNIHIGTNYVSKLKRLCRKRQLQSLEIWAGCREHHQHLHVACFPQLCSNQLCKLQLGGFLTCTHGIPLRPSITV